MSEIRRDIMWFIGILLVMILYTVDDMQDKRNTTDIQIARIKTGYVR